MNRKDKLTQLMNVTNELIDEFDVMETEDLKDITQYEINEVIDYLVSAWDHMDSIRNELE